MNKTAMYRHLNRSEDIDVSPYLSKHDLNEIARAVKHLESYENNSAVREFLNETLEYGLIKLGVAYLLKKEK